MNIKIVKRVRMAHETTPPESCSDQFLFVCPSVRHKMTFVILNCNRTHTIWKP